MKFDRLNTEYPGDDARDVYRALERHYFKVSARSPDPELSLDIIRSLLPLYDGEDVLAVTRRVDEFLSQRGSTIATIYAQEKPESMSALIYHPETLPLYERLDHDLDATRARRNQRYPEKEPERIATTFGMSFD